MNKVLFTAFALGLAAAATAQLQPRDTIHWVNGSSTHEARVSTFTLTDIAYQVRGGGSETRPADQVLSIELGRFNDAFKRGISGNDPGLFLTESRRLKDSTRGGDKLLAQFGYVETARRYWEDFGEPITAVQVIDELADEFPESGLVPERYRLKLMIYLGTGQIRDASAVATAYYADATSNGWPSGFAYEANFYQILSKKISGSASPAEIQNELRSLISKVRGAYQTIANKANVELANSLRESGNAAAALKIYEVLVDEDNLDDQTRAGTYLGLGNGKSGVSTERHLRGHADRNRHDRQRRDGRHHGKRPKPVADC